MTGIFDAEEFAAKAFDQHLRDIAATVAAHIDDESLFANLRIVILDEFANAVVTHIGNVDVADLAAGGFAHGFAVVFDPFEIKETGFAGDRAIGDVAGAVHGGLGVDGPLHGTIGLVAE